MPTPFYHLSVARELLEHPVLAESVRAFLFQERAAFFFGCTAPDVQTLSGQARFETHFFDLPLSINKLSPWKVLLRHHPDLAQPEMLDPSRGAFLIGYLLHLQADWRWVREIFVPYFGKRSLWETFPRRLYLHNILRSYIDQEILPSLTNGNQPQLHQAVPAAWLPFVDDHYLFLWRDFLAEQLQPGATVRTVEVFASRQGISPEEYYQLLSSEERIQDEVFAYFPREHLANYRQALIDENLQLINDYLRNMFNGI